MRKLLHIILIASILFACKQENQADLPVIDFESAINSATEIKCSDFIESFEYIPLETNDGCLIDKLRTIHFLDKNMVVQDVHNCFIFDSTTGKFKNQVARRGRGPGEYRSTIELIDKETNTVFFMGQSGDLLEYSLQNEFIRSIEIPTFDNSFDTPSFPIAYTSYKDWIVCHFCNMIGTEKKFLMGINKNNGSADFIIPNKNVFENKGMKMSTREVAFYELNNEFYMKEDYNDTIFNLQDSVLVPHMVLKTGQYQLTHEMYWDQNIDSKEYVAPGDVFESNIFLTFQYYYQQKPYFGLYSKKQQKVAITEIEKGLVNDIDEFINFKPRMGITNYSLIGVADAYTVAEWFLKNPEKAAQLPPHLQKLKTIKETDNPVVMIAQLKK